MRLIGLTGGVGSGKSTVAALLREFGASVVDADEGSRAVVEPGTPGFEAVIKTFGPDYVKDGRLDREKLGTLVFNDSAAREKLNRITHPLIREWMAAQTAEALQNGSTVIQDVPLLYENGLDGMFDSVIVVYAPVDVQVQRLVQGRGSTEERALAVIAAQMSIEDKRRRATYVIDNSRTEQETRAQVKRLWDELS
jgi:dephospho-CoA kinase